MSDVNIAKLRKLDAAATKGPWEEHGIANAHCTIRCSGGDIVDDVWLDDAALIVALRNAAPDMLDELERLRRFRDAVMEFASVTSIGNACWSKRSFEVFPTLEACIADERAALAKEKVNG